MQIAAKVVILSPQSVESCPLMTQNGLTVQDHLQLQAGGCFAAWQRSPQKLQACNFYYCAESWKEEDKELHLSSNLLHFYAGPRRQGFLALAAYLISMLVAQDERRAPSLLCLPALTVATQMPMGCPHAGLSILQENTCIVQFHVKGEKTIKNTQLTTSLSLSSIYPSTHPL